MTYDDFYNNNKNPFGNEPEKIMVEYGNRISQKHPVLDIGAGQGRNTIFLSKLGFSVEAIGTSVFSVQTLKSLNEKLHI